MLPATALAQQPASCLSSDPAQWPSRSKPYFMLVVDSSASMGTNIQGNIANTCGFGKTRMGHAKCAVTKAVQTFAGTVNFGLAQFATLMDSCQGGNCYNQCVGYCYSKEIDTTGTCFGCGPKPGDATTRAGARVLVPMRQDSFWTTPTPTNIDLVLQYLDDKCPSSMEVVQAGNTPLNGTLRDMKRYFQTGWTAPDNSVSYPTPLTANDLACRSINVILLTDGDETCDTQADAVSAAQDLFQNGVTVAGNTYKIKVHVINFVGGSKANTDAIAAAGGTTTSYLASDETSLSQALSNIVAGAIRPEVCDNLDNDCNGCVDEGFRHYCQQGQTCCNWTTQAQRTTCLNNYRASITAANPEGNPALLPCTTAAQATDPSTWLCYDPGEVCDNVDNNCVDGVDERVLRCGSPLHCPVAEICNGEDDDCDGLIDEELTGCNPCVPADEVCDGCDNDCDGLVDEGLSPIACGFSNPPNCRGELTCKPVQATVAPGACVAGGGFNACSNDPQPETCDSQDNDCNGIVDDGIAPTSCVPVGAPADLNFGPNSQCRQGTKACGATTCDGFVGPSTEICDGIDNDCDGSVDEDPVGVGQPCGQTGGECVPGTMACTMGTLTCTGGVRPASEICDGKDNDCDGQIDEAPLADEPAADKQGCWDLPGTCCNFKNVSWCPPTGASCHEADVIGAPCAAGRLSCAGAAGWSCRNARSPQPEVCDGIDNDCDGIPDDGMLPGAGAPCGDDTGQCMSGVTMCQGGSFACSGQGPVEEACNGLDDDCDGEVDEDVITGMACQVAYDTTAYPGARDLGACKTGRTRCTPSGESVCEGGMAPSPELCNGIDDDCDGEVDEPGAAPDGTDQTAVSGGGQLGGPCRASLGACASAVWTCVSGIAACEGPEPEPELCDGIDNDCDGQIDESDDGPICGEGIDCVRHEDVSACSYQCDEFRRGCPVGQACTAVVDSNTGEPRGTFCVASADAGYTPPLRTARPDTSGCGCGSGPGDSSFFAFALLGFLLVAGGRSRRMRVTARAEVRR